MWYSFTASTPSLVLNFIQNNSTDAPPNYVVYGPYTSLTTGCANVTSACSGGSVLATAQPTNHVTGPVGGVSYNLINGDPGKFTQLTGLTTTAGNNTYLVQVQNNEAGGPAAGFATFCIGVHPPATNTFPQTASAINSCGVTFNGSSAGGYYPNASGAGFSNLDNNAGTQCATCAAGADITYVINNPSWFTFCSANAGTYNVQFDVISCVNSSFTGATGGQMAILTGSTSNFTNVWQATSPTLTNTAVQTSPNFTLAAGGCAYLVVDGFAGDACSYSYVLTNVSGGCVLLPIELLSFNAKQNQGSVDLTWATATEKENDFFTVEKSLDGMNFIAIKEVDGAGMSTDVMFYSAKDLNPTYGLSYYRLKQTDFNGNSSYSKVVSVDFRNENDLEFDIVPNPSIENEKSKIVLSVIPEKEITIIVTDINGVVCFEEMKKVSDNKVEIPNDFSKGIYIVKIMSSDNLQTKRMIIK